MDRAKLLDMIISHLTSLKGNGLKELLDQSKMDDLKKPEEMGSMDEPKGLSIQKVEVMGKPKGLEDDDSAEDAMKDIHSNDMNNKMSDSDGMPDSNEPTDEELEEMYSKLMKS